jgi:Tol biopolymer transport system component
LSLPPGTRLGVYAITAQIGEGGMGEVYRATDSSLKRSVAIKVLPASVASDADRLARFQREAEVLAALNHPNIAAIYGLEKTADLTAIVMELVEGEDLSQRIPRGPIPIDEALPIAKQIADALEAAHEQGIVHRDLKPANIKLRSDGTVKVLDFGLAKAMDRADGSSANAMNSPTLSMHATEAGLILGTAAYMSPEQASGKRVDKRADVWSFGVVLFEMLTGRRLFDGETVSHTLADVLRAPIEFDRLPACTPPAIRELLRRCLHRDGKKRLRDMGEARIAIEDAISGTAREDAPLAPLRESRSIVATALPWALVTALAILAMLLWAPWRVTVPAEQPLVRLDVDLGADAAFATASTGGSNIAISPDGTRLVYVAGTPLRLFTRRLDQSKAVELPGTQGAELPFFSPDGQWVGFGAPQKVSKISVEGGAVVSVGTQDGSFAGASWGEDGSLIVSDAFGKGLLQFPAAGGAPTAVTPLRDGEAALAVPQVLPGGKAILFAACTVGTVDNCNIEVLTIADGQRKVLIHGGQSPHYLPSSNSSGHLIYVNKATLFAVGFDLTTLETRGSAVPVVDDVAYAPVTSAGLFDISRTGTLIYRRSHPDLATLATLQWVDAAGKRESIRSTPISFVAGQIPRISPDGKRIALTLSDGPSQDIWIYDPQRDAMTRLTSGGVHVNVTWNPDGQSVAFAKMGQGILLARADGASPPQALTVTKNQQYPYSFTPDGKRLAYYEVIGKPQLWTVPIEDHGGRLTAGKPEQFLVSSFVDQNPLFSPDGRWLAYYSNESGRNEVYVRAFPPPASGQGGKWQLSNNGGTSARWSRAGHELVYRSGTQLMRVSYAVEGQTFIAEKPRVWIADLGTVLWDLAPDGKRVAVLMPEGGGQPAQPEHQIVMLQNFADELRRRVPLPK